MGGAPDPDIEDDGVKEWPQRQNYPIKYRDFAAERFERMKGVSILNMFLTDEKLKAPHGSRRGFIYRLDQNLIDFINKNFSKVISLFTMTLLMQGSDNGRFKQFATQYAITPTFEQTIDDPLFVAVGALEWTEEDVRKADEKMEKQKKASREEYDQIQQKFIQDNLDKKAKAEKEGEEPPPDYIPYVYDEEKEAKEREREITLRDKQQQKLDAYMERRTIAQKEEDEATLAVLKQQYKNSAKWLRGIVTAAAERATADAERAAGVAAEVSAAGNCLPCEKLDKNSYLWGTLRKKRGIGKIFTSELRYLKLYNDDTGWMFMYADDQSMTTNPVTIRLSSNNPSIVPDIRRVNTYYKDSKEILKLLYRKGKKTKSGNDSIEFYMTCLEKHSSEIKLCVRNTKMSESDRREWIDLMNDEFETIGSFKKIFNRYRCDQINMLWMKCLNSCIMKERDFDLFKSYTRQEDY